MQIKLELPKVSTLRDSDASIYHVAEADIYETK